VAQPFSQIQTAVVTLFRGSVAMQAAMTGATAPTYNILDNVPVNTAFPYVYVGDMIGRPGSALGLNKQKATDVLLSLHIFSQYSGWKEVDAIMDVADNLLNENSLTLTGGFINFFIQFDNYIPLVEKDGLTRHGYLRYRLMCQN
jgi:Protein of unknown function (DUF3168)